MPLTHDAEAETLETAGSFAGAPPSDTEALEVPASAASASPLVPMAVALAVMVVWGGTPLFTKVATRDIDPLQVGILRTLIAGALAVPILAVSRRPFPATRQGKGLLMFSGAAAFVAFPLMFGIGQARTSATHGALVLATLPVFTSLFGTLLERRSVSAKWVVGCGIALAGEAAVIALRFGDSAGSASVRGDLIVLVSALVCSMGYVAGARLAQTGYPSLSTTLWGVALASLVVLPLGGWTVARVGWPSAGAASWASVLVLAVLTSIVGYMAWYWALAKGGISRVASVQFTQPLFGLVLAAIVLGERPGPVTLVAAVAILTGAWLVQHSAKH